METHKTYCINYTHAPTLHPANIVRNKYVIITSRRRFDVTITNLLRSLFARHVVYNMALIQTDDVHWKILLTSSAPRHLMDTTTQAIHMFSYFEDCSWHIVAGKCWLDSRKMDTVNAGQWSSSPSYDEYIRPTQKYFFYNTRGTPPSVVIAPRWLLVLLEIEQGQYLYMRADMQNVCFRIYGKSYRPK